MAFLQAKFTSKADGFRDLPAQHTQHQVENKEGAKDDQANKVDPGQLEAHCVVHLHRDTGREGKKVEMDLSIWSIKFDYIFTK